MIAVIFGTGLDEELERPKRVILYNSDWIATDSARNRVDFSGYSEPWQKVGISLISNNRIQQIDIF